MDSFMESLTQKNVNKSCTFVIVFFSFIVLSSVYFYLATITTEQLQSINSSWMPQENCEKPHIQPITFSHCQRKKNKKGNCQNSHQKPMQNRTPFKRAPGFFHFMTPQIISCLSSFCLCPDNEAAQMGDTRDLLVLA